MSTPSDGGAYLRVVRDLAAQIADGKLCPGDPLPSYRQLADLYQVHVSTVQRALMILRDRGLVQGQQGKGTYVAEPPEG